MPVTHVAKWPIVNPDPSNMEVLTNVSAIDYVKAALWTGGGFAVGWFSSRRNLRVPYARFNAMVGFVTGMGLAYQNSHHRLMGLNENSYEVRNFGVMPKAQVDAIHNRHMPAVDLIKAKDDSPNVFN